VKVASWMNVNRSQEWGQERKGRKTELTLLFRLVPEPCTQ